MHDKSDILKHFLLWKHRIMLPSIVMRFLVIIKLCHIFSIICFDPSLGWKKLFINIIENSQFLMPCPSLWKCCCWWGWWGFFSTEYYWDLRWSLAVVGGTQLCVTARHGLIRRGRCWGVTLLLWIMCLLLLFGKRSVGSRCETEEGWRFWLWLYGLVCRWLLRLPRMDPLRGSRFLC